MTPAEIVEALCEAHVEATWHPTLTVAAIARRDEIKAALCDYIDYPCYETWQRLEEACRGDSGSAAEAAEHIPSHWRGYRDRRRDGRE